jgi:hypothetical protein
MVGLHLDAVVDVSTCLRPCGLRATRHRRYKHEDAERVVRPFHRGSLASVRVRMAHQIIRAGEKRGYGKSPPATGVVVGRAERRISDG